MKKSKINIKEVTVAKFSILNPKFKLIFLIEIKWEKKYI